MKSELADFIKLEGCGNDFVVLSEGLNVQRDWAPLARKICDRHFGVGADGLLVVREAEQGSGCDFDVLMFNPDGSWMGMCGNGIRCVSRFVALRGMFKGVQGCLRFNVGGRTIVCFLSEQGSIVRVDMGTPSFEPVDLPLNAPSAMLMSPLEVGGQEYQVSCVSIPT